MIVENNRKIEKSKAEAQNNEVELAKKREELRTIEQNIKILQSGGQVEDQALTLKKNIETAQIDLEAIVLKRKQIQNEINRKKVAAEESKKDLSERQVDTDKMAVKKAQLASQIEALEKKLLA